VDGSIQCFPAGASSKQSEVIESISGAKRFTRRVQFIVLPVMNLRKFGMFVLAAVFLCGCATTVTNLTPSQEPRNANNIYPFEVSLKTSQQTIRQDTIEPFVLIGTSIYPMHPALGPCSGEYELRLLPLQIRLQIRPHVPARQEQPSFGHLPVGNSR
jgi:hypothetical protein